MPAVSQAQYRFMQGVAHGAIKRKGLSRRAAAEYVAGQSPQDLPERTGEKASALDKIKAGLREHRRRNG